jgi:hypothetical protein
VGLDVEPAVEVAAERRQRQQEVARGVELRLPGEAGVEAGGRAAHVDAQLASAERAPGPQQPLEARPVLAATEREHGRRSLEAGRVDAPDADLEVEPQVVGPRAHLAQVAGVESRADPGQQAEEVAVEPLLAHPGEGLERVERSAWDREAIEADAHQTGSDALPRPRQR